MANSMSEYRQNGVDYIIDDPTVAPVFVDNTAYIAGQLVKHQGNLYRFTVDHPAGAWNASHVVQVTVSGEIISQKAAVEAEAAARQSGDAAVLAQLAPEFAEDTAYTAGEYVTNQGTVYQLPAGHDVGTTWENTQKVATNVGQEMSNLSKALDETSAFITEEIKYGIDAESSGCRIVSRKWVANSILNSNGEIVSYNGRITCPEYLKFDRDVILLNMNNNPNITFVRYDDNFNVVQRRTTTTPTLKIPAGSMFRFTFFTDGETITDPFAIAKNILIMESKTGRQEDFGFKYKNLFDVDEISENVSFSGETSTIVEAEGSLISDYIPIKKGIPVCVFVNHETVFNKTNSGTKVAVYNQEKEWMVTFNNSTDALDTSAWHDFGVDGFLRISTLSNVTSLVVAKSTLIVVRRDLFNENPYAVVPENMLGEPFNLFDYDPANMQKNKGYSRDTDVIVDTNNSSITGYIPVHWYDKILIKYGETDYIPTPVTHHTKIILYSKTKTWVRTIDLTRSTDLHYITSPLQIDFDGYIRVQYVHANGDFFIGIDGFRKIKGDLTDTGNEVDVIVFAGQSNMAGRGETSVEYPETAPVVPYGWAFEYKAITEPNDIIPLAEPFGRSENSASGINDGTKKTGSIVAAFAIEYYKHNGNHPLIGVSASKGGSGIDEWQPGAESGYLADAINRFNNCITFLEGKGYTIRHKFLCWCQGEHDWETVETYEARWQTMYNQFKAAGIEKCLMVRIGNTGSGDGHFTDMIAEQTRMAATNKDIVMVSLDFAGMADRGLMKDDLHYLQAGYNECGEYAGVNAAIFATTGKEPTMYDPETDTLYYSKKN